MTQFKNPFANLPDSETDQVVFRIPKALSNHLKQIRLRNGTMTGIAGHLFEKLWYELRKRNITDFTKCAEFEHFVSNCVICLPGDGGLRQRTSGRTSTKRSRVDAGADKGTCDQPPADETKLSDV